MKRVLILSAPIGSGHKMTAQALVQEMQKKENIEVFEGDVFSFMPAWIGKTFLFCYLKLLVICPWLYGLAYGSASSSNAEKHSLKDGQSKLWLRKLINSMLLKLGEAYLDKIKPDIVLATHATPLGIMSLYKKQYSGLWLGAVVPDYNIHPWWLYEDVDVYFLADEGLRQRFPADTDVQSLGLPLREAFKAGSREQYRTELGYGQERIVLLMGGGDGLLPMEQVVASIMKAELQNVRLVAITGHNQRIYKVLQKRFKGVSEKQLQVFGYREDVPKLLLAADVLISKGGAVTAAEALACGLDYIIFKPLPGQETGNARYLAKNYDVKIAQNVEEIAALLNNCANNKTVNCEALTKRKLAAERICEYVLQQVC